MTMYCQWVMLHFADHIGSLGGPNSGMIVAATMIHFRTSVYYLLQLNANYVRSWSATIFWVCLSAALLNYDVKKLDQRVCQVVLLNLDLILDKNVFINKQLHQRYLLCNTQYTMCIPILQKNTKKKPSEEMRENSLYHSVLYHALS